MSSYNYLGFAQSEGPCADAVEECVKRYGLTSASPRMDSGTTDLALEVEREIAAFVASPLPWFSLWISQPRLIRIGARLSGAVIKSSSTTTWPTSSVSSVRPSLKVSPEPIALEEDSCCRGRSLLHGRYHGDLPGILSLKDKYKFYLYIDEAHSVGALGPRGRGSFGANGGYIAANKDIIDKLKSSNMITGELCPGQGEERLERIAFNSRYLRLGLKRLGYIVSGHDDSPIVPVMLYHPAKIPAFSHEMLRRKISVVVVGYPATPLITSRARFCVSSAHNKEILTACWSLATKSQTVCS
ncbi:unnamed protein product [Clonostachys rosea f. rosea IK726]|uniref:Uncharacterized protein n=1 Tax=Clonostachys rosea f. rosea IK726 TaxID=1349383 RepID=A0ACA9U9R0_BIOOC|nr:unnamed protein product [Clonostachys rosea f. rosea IK726]